MATSTARSFPPRLPASMVEGRAAPFRGANDDVRAGARETGSEPRREPAWLTDLTTQIARSIDAIEHMVERIGTMRENNSYLRAVTVNLREALEVERLESGRKLAAQDFSMSQQKRRAVEAELSADSLAGMLCDLERQITGRRERG